MSVCIPFATGIWGGAGGATMGTPPNWGIAGVSTHVIDTVDSSRPQEGAVNDPRWLGAINQSFGVGAAEEASFRALFSDEGGKRYLYSSWFVKFDGDPTSVIDCLYAVIAPSSGGGVPLIVKVTPFDFTGDVLTAQVPSTIQQGNLIADPAHPGTGTFQELVNRPDWLNDTRVWRWGSAAPQCQWAIHMRVPIDPAATDVGHNSGLRLVGSFKMWYELRVKTVTPTFSEWVQNHSYQIGDLVSDQGNFYTCIVAHTSSAALEPLYAADKWQRRYITTAGMLRLNEPAGVSLTNSGNNYPDPNTSGLEFTFGNEVGIAQVSCPGGGGISMTLDDVGTTNNPTSYIDPVNTNTFYARPTNNTGTDVPAGAINATFRLANWGSTRMDAGWTTIQSGVQNSDVIPSGHKADPTNDIRFNKGNVAANYYPNVSQEPHQCMLVELSGGGLLFTTTSVCRNMDFIINSKDVRSAEINIAKIQPLSDLPRDIFLAVEIRNMPEKVGRDLKMFAPVFDSGIQPTGYDKENPASLYNKVQVAKTIIQKQMGSTMTNERFATAQARLGLMLAALSEAGATAEDYDQLFPTFRVHVYYDSGETTTVNGITYPLLDLMPSFGYYAYHEGELIGYNTQIRGAIRVASNFYILRVPNNGSSKITTIVHGIALGEEKEIEPNEPIQNWPDKPQPCGCLCRILKLLGIARKEMRA